MGVPENRMTDMGRIALCLVVLVAFVHSDADDMWEEQQGSDAQLSSQLSSRQKVACDVCMGKMGKRSSCAQYVPDGKMFDGTRPDPERNLGRLWECKPSEREMWTTDGRFKLGKDERENCPSERRQPYYNGLVASARRMCGLFSRKLGGISTSEESCSAFANSAARVSGRTISCANRFFSDAPKPAPKPGPKPAPNPSPSQPPVLKAGVAGMFTDPNHYKPGGLAGTRFISDRVGNTPGSKLTLVGTDDGITFWTLTGTVDNNVVVVDFSPKGGPANLQGIYSNGAITWPDGNKWTKMKALGSDGTDGGLRRRRQLSTARRRRSFRN